MKETTSLLGACLILSACHGGDTESPVTPPGSPESAETRVLAAGAAFLQSAPPIGQINAYLDGFHFYNGNMAGQMEAHHYCSILNDDMIQCVIYDGNVKDAKIMGVEYIITEKLFAPLAPGEKALWHSHVHEVKSGQLVAPGIPEAAEHALMAKLVHTYGKTWHTWHTDLDKALPLGVPQLMMGFTADGQADGAMIKARDERLGVDTEKRKQQRADIVAPPIDPGANGWQHGATIQIDDPTGTSHGLKRAHGERAGSAPNGRSAANERAPGSK